MSNYSFKSDTFVLTLFRLIRLLPQIKFCVNKLWYMRWVNLPLHIASWYKRLNLSILFNHWIHNLNVSRQTITSFTRFRFGYSRFRFHFYLKVSLMNHLSEFFMTSLQFLILIISFSIVPIYSLIAHISILYYIH